MKQTIIPFLMFTGKAEEAMTFYIGIFKNSQILNITRYEENELGKEGSIKQATFQLNGQEFMIIDSYIEHAFTFTPSLSMYVRCVDEQEINQLSLKLSNEGIVLMPLDSYPFSRKFTWIQDKYGVSWQLSLE